MADKKGQCRKTCFLLSMFVGQKSRHFFYSISKEKFKALRDKFSRSLLENLKNINRFFDGTCQAGEVRKSGKCASAGGLKNDLFIEGFMKHHPF